jgi:DNA-binding NarL/FixJ family response regulator
VTINILILEPHPLIRLGLVQLLEEQPRLRVWMVADSAATALNCLQQGLYEEQLPDMLVMSPVSQDLGRSVEFVQQVRQSHGQIRILALLENGDAAKAAATVLAHSGVNGCCLKSKPPIHILQAIEAIAAKTGWMDVELRESAGMWRSRPQLPQTSVIANSSHRRLSQRERQVLKEIAAGKNNREIARSLQVAESTIKSHVARILRKLGARDRTQAVVRAFREGWV